MAPAAQSYYSSINQATTAAAFCTAAAEVQSGSPGPSSGSSGPNPAVVAPAVVVPVVGIAALGALAWWATKTGLIPKVFGGKAAAGAASSGAGGGGGAAPMTQTPGGAPLMGGGGAAPVGGGGAGGGTAPVGVDQVTQPLVNQINQVSNPLAQQVTNPFAHGGQPPAGVDQVSNPLSQPAWNGVSGGEHGFEGNIAGHGMEAQPMMHQNPVVPPIVVGGYYNRRDSGEGGRQPPPPRTVSSTSSAWLTGRRNVGAYEAVSPNDPDHMSMSSGMPVSELGYDRPDQVGWTQLDNNEIYEAPGHENQPSWQGYQGQGYQGGRGGQREYRH